ncbi:unnamed protein product, partial [Trichobilharzia regenti]
PTGSETTKRLISQLLAALDKEAVWITDFESQILKMGHLSLDDNLNRHLLDDHQEILDKIRIRQSTSRSILFQAEQAVEALRNGNQSEFIWKPLQSKCQELRTRLEDLQTEAESRVRILLNSLDSLEHLTYKLQSLRSLLENLESVLVLSASNTTMKAYNNKLNHFTGLKGKQYEEEMERNDRELEDRIQNTVKEANNRLVQLLSRLETQSTHLNEVDAINNHYQKQLSESTSQLDKIKLQLSNIQKSTLESVDLHSLKDKLTEANLISNNLISVITEPLSNSLIYQKQLSDQCEQLEKQFMKYILTNQTVQECLNEFMNHTDRIGDDLSRDSVGDKSIIKTDGLPSDLTKLHETLAHINTMQSASQSIRDRLNQTVEEVKLTDPSKLRAVQSELKQTDVLDNRLETLKDDVISRISQLSSLRNEFAQYENDINEFHTWLDQIGNQLNSQATAHLPENYLKHKLQMIKMQIPNRQLHLDSLQQSVEALVTRLPESDGDVKLIKENMCNLNKRWSQLLGLLDTREDDLKARESLSDSYIQARNQVQEMLLTADGRLTTLSSPITLNMNTLNQQLERLNSVHSFWETIKTHLTEADQLGSAYDTLLHTSSGVEKHFGRGATSHDPYVPPASRVSTFMAYKENKLMNILSPMASSGSSGISSADPMCNLYGKLVEAYKIPR